MNDPQVVLGVQLQVTPLFAMSFDTVAVTLAMLFVCIEVGGAVVIATEIGGGAVIVTVTVALFVVSLTDVAVIVTPPPVGTFAGAA